MEFMAMGKEKPTGLVLRGRKKINLVQKIMRTINKSLKFE